MPVTPPKRVILPLVAAGVLATVVVTAQAHDNPRPAEPTPRTTSSEADRTATPVPPKEPVRGTPIQANVEPPATLGGLVEIRLPVGSTVDQPGLRTLRIDGELPEPAVTESPGGNLTLGPERAITRADAGLQTEADDPTLSSASLGEVGWLLSVSEGLLASASAAPTEAAAIQVAAWTLIGAVRPDDPTANTEVNARARTLVSEARGKFLSSSVVTASSSHACLDQATRILLIGPPGAGVSAGVAGPASLLTSSATLDSAGRGTISLRSARPGTLTLAVRSRGRQLARVSTSLPAGSSRPSTEGLNLLTLRPIDLAGGSLLGSRDCTDDRPVDDTVPPTGSRAIRQPSRGYDGTGLAVSGVRGENLGNGQRRLRIEVENTSSGAIGDVLVTAGIPAGREVLSGARELAVGTIGWKLPRIEAGQAQTLEAVVRATPGGQTVALPDENGGSDRNP